MAKPSKEVVEKAIELSGVDAESFKTLSKDDRTRFMHEASIALNAQDQTADGVTGATELVQMKRDPEAYPEPHTCLVHPDEVENYQLGGWVHAE